MRVGSTTSRPEDLGFTPLGANRLEVDTTWSSCREAETIVARNQWGA
jgi:hypothetical protein